MEWSRLPGEAVCFIVGILTAQWDKTLRNLVWPQSWSCCTQQDGAVAPEVPSHLKLPCGPCFTQMCADVRAGFLCSQFAQGGTSKSPSPLLTLLSWITNITQLNQTIRWFFCLHFHILLGLGQLQVHPMNHYCHTNEYFKLYARFY